MTAKKLELQDALSFHFVFVGFAEFENVLKNLKNNLPYYRISFAEKTEEKEVFYDVANELLSSAGLVLSKWYNHGKIYFHVRKISNLKNVSRRFSKKFLFGPCEEKDEPRDYSLQIATAIENSFSSPFTVDLDSMVKRTMPIFDVNVKSEKYDVICGTGYRATLLYENATYRDLDTGKKASRLGVTLNVPIEDRPETAEILDVISKRVLGLAFFDNSRFELGQKLLYSQPEEMPIEYDEDQEEDDEE